MYAKLILLKKKARNQLKQFYGCTKCLHQKNIYDYLARPEEKYDKDYSKERKEIIKYIRKDNLTTKKDVGVIDWGYLLKAVDGF